ncbi:4-hydroxy-3-methylbut-2-enyl diphosphate reductase [Jidongwangia harbinensis]|uniref:4-hydroxy-3-methylbut-2-enyl diphosphate reductase n=1 Tax=Jidongwangia harbinensis TaxID=2878561 RepID=UPI001CD92069|nr:4-hydroxy-3-methylbut-2-enyl diphosphate reductase [Jidongwangia harbinensis]MCA2211632.1 4-hydroxy-3-methylbut-2-enyl diphosphate reductase [Jidongwangia harbinensis]
MVPTLSTRPDGHPAGRTVILAEPRGFCAGVRRAIAMVERALEVHGPPVYVRKQIVHNHHVVSVLERKGARFVESEDEVPEGAVCVFSAHGVAPAVHENARRRDLDVIDATCPLVSTVHQQARRVVRDGRLLLLIGHADHEETEGTRGEAAERTVVVETEADVDRLDLPPDTPVAYLTQTTLSVDETAGIVDRLRDRFADLLGPAKDTICYASQNRQSGIKALAARCDVVLVVGSENSSNSQRMVDVARESGSPAYLVPDVSRMDPRWLDGATRVGVSSGASAPEVLVDDLLAYLERHGFADVEVDTTSVEDVVFAVPGPLAGGPPGRDPRSPQRTLFDGAPADPTNGGIR